MSENAVVEDLEPILPTEARVTVAGCLCKIRRLKTREFLSLVQVMTAGLGNALQDVKLDFSNEETIGAELSGLMVLAIPNAVDEFTVFLRAVVEPLNADDRGKVASYLMDNPDLDVLFDVFEAVATQEKDDLAVLAGKAQAMWARVGALYSKK